MAGEQLLYKRPLPGARLNMAHPLARGLVGCWLFNDGGGMRAMDLSPYGNHGALVGFASPPSRPFNGLPFDGSATYVHLAVSNFRGADTKGAIEVWFKTTSGVGSPCLFGSADIGTAAQYYFFFGINTSGQLLVILTEAGNTNSMRGATDVRDGLWHHALLSSDGSSWTIILDKVAETLTVIEGSNSGAWFSSITLRDNCTFGALKYNAVGDYLTGTLGLVRVYSERRSLAEAQALYLQPYNPYGIRMFI